MEVINKIILGIIQGISELLPISSSAHLLLTSELFNIQMDSFFLTFLHFMTALAIIFGFWDEIKYVYNSKERKNLIKVLLIGIIPTGIMGALLYSNIQNIYANFTLIIFNLILVGILMILVDKYMFKKSSLKKLEEIAPKNALLIGIAQAIALMPGISRSGITIVSGIFNGLNKKTAVTFSFLIGLPLIMFSFFFELFKNPHSVDEIFKQENLLGGLAAFVFGYFAVLILKRIPHTNFLTVFGIYRIILGIILILAI